MDNRIVDWGINTEQGQKKMDDDIDIECLLKERRPTIEDIECLAREINDNPNDLKKLYELLGLSDDELSGTDRVDGAPILSHRLTPDRCADITYERIVTALPNRRDVAVKYCKNLIPTYILARRVLAAYQKALQSGTTNDKRVKVMLIGEDDAGKTSLGKALKGEALNQDEASTDGVLISEVIENASEKPWQNSKVHRKLSVVNQNAKSPGSLIQTDGNVTSRVTREVDVENLTEDDLGYDEVDNCRDEADGICPVIWDFAGQAVYRAIHPMFMSPEAVYVLVFDLSKSLFDKTGENSGDNLSVLNPDNEDSNLDHIMRWMDMVRSLRRSTEGDTLPPVILVGTHADCVENPETIMNSLLDRFCRHPLLGEHVAGSVVVDNTSAGKARGQEDPQIVRLRRMILDEANKMPHTKREVPRQWLDIESKIHQEKAQSGVKYIPKRFFKEEIVEKACNIQDVGDVEPILHFLHDRGTIIYHEHANDPHNLVVLDPQWLVNVLCKIITVEPSRDESITIRSHRKKLQEKGILAKELLDHTCKELGVDQVQQSLLLLMEKFNLLFRCPCKDSQEIYLVPCMLKARPGSEIVPLANDTSSPPVYLTFKTEYVPVGLFSRLVVPFGVLAATKSSCEQQQVYANAARFVLDGKNFLGLVCFKSVIKLQLWSQDNSDPFGFGDSGLHAEVYSYLLRSLEKMREECHWLRSLSWELCVQCRLCAGKVDSNTGNCVWHDTNGCLHDDCAHYMSLKSHQLHCPDGKGPDLFLPEENFQPWIQAVNNNNIPAVETVGQSTLMPGKPETVLISSNVTRVVLLAGEWGSSKGGLPTINRQLAIELAKSPNLEVSFYVIKCTEEEKCIAADNGITIIVAKKRPGYEDLDWLGFPPEELPVIDVVVGHGAKLGKQAQLFLSSFPKCVWVQFVHTAPEELSMYKTYDCNISKGEKKHHTEVQLSELADLVVAVGPKLSEDYKTYLRSDPKKKVFEITPDPSIFHEFKECQQAKEDRENFSVLAFGRGDSEDFKLKGFDIAAKAIAELKDKRYRLYCVGAPRGSEEEVAERLREQGICPDQLVVRGFIESRKDLAKLLCEVDLAIMPSRTEGFGLTALEALSAGLPILVSGNSGFAKALEKMGSPLASSCIVGSVDAKDWAAAIRAVKENPRSQRLQDAKRLKKDYEKTFVWSKRCTALLRGILALVQERRGEDKDSGAQQDEAQTDVHSVEVLEKGNDTQSLSGYGRRPEDVEEPEEHNHGCEQEDDCTYTNSELGATAKEDIKDKVVVEPPISPQIEETILNNQEVVESFVKQDDFQETKEGFQEADGNATVEQSIKDIRRRRGVQWRLDCEKNTKEYVKPSKNDQTQVWHSNLTKTFTAMLVAAALLSVIGAYILQS